MVSYDCGLMLWLVVFFVMLLKNCLIWCGVGIGLGCVNGVLISVLRVGDSFDMVDSCDFDVEKWIVGEGRRMIRRNRRRRWCDWYLKKG